MECVLTLVVSPDQDSLTEGLVATARNALKARHASVSPPDWLAAGIACDVAFAGCDADVAESAVRQALADVPVDIFVQDAATRRKMLLIADMDSTMVTGETLDDLAGLAGLKTEIAAITERAMRGELEFEGALRERVAMLKGLAATALDEAFALIEYTPGAHALVKTMAAHGAHTMLVSGGFSYFTERVAAACGFAENRANLLIIENGQLTGDVAEPILGRDAKLRALVEGAGARRMPLSLTCAVGDGANDLAMIQAAGLGVAYHAKPIVREASRFQVDHGDLTALLYAQGYRREQIVT